jgi:hypothetical protein
MKNPFETSTEKEEMKNPFQESNNIANPFNSEGDLNKVDYSTIIRNLK